MEKQQAAPAIKLRRAPRCDPPFDDEREPETWTSPHQLTLDWSRPATRRTIRFGGSPGWGGPPVPGDAAGPSNAAKSGSTHDARPAARSENAADAGPAAGSRSAVPSSATPHVPARTARRTAVSGVSPDAKLAVRRFVSSCVEVLNGYRPAAHLRRLAQPREAATVVAQGLVGAQRVAEARRRTSFHARVRRPTPVAVVRSSLCEPRPGAVEAAVVLLIGDRTWAMALRLEQHDEAWLATVMRLI